MQAAVADSAPDTRELDRAVEVAVETRLRGVLDEAKARAAQLLAYSRESPAAIAEFAVCEVLAKRASRVDIEAVRDALRLEHANDPAKLYYIERITRCGYNDEHCAIWARPDDAPRTAMGQFAPEALFHLFYSGSINQFMKRAG